MDVLSPTAVLRRSPPTMRKPVSRPTSVLSGGVAAEAVPLLALRSLAFQAECAQPLLNFMC